MDLRLAIVLLLGVTGTPLSAAPRLFDMGTADSEVREGFTRASARSLYDRQQGFGWKTREGLREHDHHYPRQWQFNEGRGTSQPPPIYTNEVTRDCLWSTQANSFLVDLPPGEYMVYLLCGRSAGSPREYHEFTVAAGPAETKVQIPGPYIFEKRRLKTKVERGPLSVDFRPQTDWLLAALAVIPASEVEEVERTVIGPLERDTFFLPPDVAAEWKETKHVDDRPMPRFSPADRARGFALFARHWSEVIYPNTVPRHSELDPSLEAFASWGEYEPLTLTIHPLAALPAARVTASDLRCGQSVLPAAGIDVRYVRNMLVRPNYSLYHSYHVAPDVLEHRDAVDLEPGRNQTVWVTVKVPADAPAGVYSGHLTVQVPGAALARTPIRLRVLPIRLKTNPDHVYGNYYHDPLSQVDGRNHPLANAYFQRKAEWERQDMVEHGMNCHISHASGLKREAPGRWTMEGEETERRIALDRKFGLAERPLVVSFPVGHYYGQLVDKRGTGSHLRLVRADVPQSFFDEVTGMVRAIEVERGRRGWPEFLYYPIDEPSTQEASVRFMVGVLKAIKQVPGVRTYVTADPSHEQFEPLWPYVDVWCCQPFVFGEEKIRRLSREKKIEFWCYPNHISGENDHTPVRGARMTWGFGFWRSGFKALVPWIYQASIGDPWNYLDGTSMDFFNRSTPEGRPIPVTLWEAYREGIDDGRYIYTLTQLAQEARKRGGAAATLGAEAEAELKHVQGAIRVQEKYKFDDLWSGRDFDAYRWLLASQILRLQEALIAKTGH